MPRLSVVAALFAAVLPVAPAVAQVATIGGTLARSCYENARAENASDRALEVCNMALTDPRSRPDQVATLVNRGIIHFFRGKTDAALLDLDAAIARDADQAEAYLNKAIVLLRHTQDRAAAVPLFTQALAKNTRKPALAHLGRGMAYELSGNINAAYADYRQAKQIAPSWAAADAELSRFQVGRN